MTLHVGSLAPAASSSLRISAAACRERGARGSPSRKVSVSP